MSIKKYYVTCYRLRPTKTTNSRNRPEVSYGSTTINGYLGSRTGLQIKVGDKETLENRYNFYCDDFNLESTDLIKYETKTYEIIGEPQNTIHKGHHMKVMLRMVSNIKQQ